MTKVNKFALGIVITLFIVVCIALNRQIQTNVLKEQITVSVEQVYDEQATDYYRNLYSDTYNFDDKVIIAYRVDICNQTPFTLKMLKSNLNITRKETILLGNNEFTDGNLDLKHSDSVGNIYYFAVPKQMNNDEMCSMIQTTNLILKCKVLWKDMRISYCLSVEDS